MTRAKRASIPSLARAAALGRIEECCILLVRECRSRTAIRKGWTWADGHLAAKPLFEALEKLGVNPRAQIYKNLWHDPPQRPSKHTQPRLKLSAVSYMRGTPLVIVALGARVAAELIRLRIDHRAIVHPAARGRIRKRTRYIAHVVERLAGHVPICNTTF